MTDPDKPSDRGDQTRSALVQAAMAEFSDNGYHAASNRDIAAQAQANQALIGYHFGGKQGLYLAVFKFISEQIQQHTGSVIAQMKAQLAACRKASHSMPRRAKPASSWCSAWSSGWPSCLSARCSSPRHS
ncbi:MAG: TetR family transcriptional regulator [Uliginosibacterium sp.]|nr:TetR family transcriptional regulator [Uliginosibacterium sp.]